MSLPISYGKKTVFKRNIFQAAIAKPKASNEAESAIDQLKKQDNKCIWVAICFKDNQNEVVYEEEEGAGTKLLGLLKRMAILDLVVGVRLWPDISLPQHDIYRMVLNQAKELIIDYLTPSGEAEKPSTRPRRVNIIEIETLPPDTSREISMTSIMKPQPSKLNIKQLSKRLKSILSKLNESEIKPLQEFIHHSVIGKVLIILLVLIQKQKPTLSLAKQYFLQTNVLAAINNLNLQALSRIQVQRAKKLLRKVSDLKPSNIEKVSKAAALLFQYIQCVISLYESQDLSLPPIQRNLLNSKGDYLKSKQMPFNTKEIVPEPIPEKKVEVPIPEPDGYQQLKGISSKKNQNFSEVYSDVNLSEEFKDERFKIARKNRLEEDFLIDRLIHMNPDEVDPDVKIDFNLSEEEVIRFLGNEELESQPTDLLLKLAERLKERRERHSLA